MCINFLYLIEDRVDHHPGQRNGRRDHRVVAVVHVHEVKVPHLGLDGHVPNPSPDRPSLNMLWKRPRIKIEKGVVRTNRTTVKGATVIGRGPRRRVAEVRKNPIRTSGGPATSQSPNNPTTKVDQRTTTARRKRQNPKAR